MRLLIIFGLISAFMAGYITSEIAISAKSGYDKLEIIEVEVTAYSPSRAQTDSNPWETASQRIIKPSELDEIGIVAVSRDLIEEYGLEWEDTVWVGFRLEDTMNARIEKTVDIFLRNQDLARKFGRQYRTIIIERRK